MEIQPATKFLHFGKLKPKTVLGMQYFAFSLVFLTIVILFSYVPLFSWSYAFFNYKPGLKIGQMNFTGLANFKKVLDDWKEVARVLRNTLVMSFIGIICSPLPALFAIMLNELSNVRFRKVAQTITTLPNFISWIVVFGVSWAMFSSSGLVPSVVKLFGGSTPSTGILGSNQWVWLFQSALGIWKSLGWNAIIYLAAISGINQDLYDAAKIDGANRLQSILHVTVPSIVPTYLVLLLLAVSNILNNGFDQYFVFYNSLVSDRIEVLDYYVYKIGILVSDYSYSIVLGMFKSLISILLLFTVNTISKNLRGNTLV
ncbi:sugar ABC transporter permease [Oscillospiraceae bacterium HV4-5-C5C]|nr:sugar ABC transporter permease [Oscillospiraceae bacterium HV4-5-C5C]